MATVGLLFAGAEPTAQRPELATSTSCEREGAKFVGSKPQKLENWQPPPKKVRDVRPTYPELPRGTRGSGMWFGELLVDAEGRVSHVWTVRQARLTPPLPEFNRAILDAVRQWQFQPFVVNSQARPVCMTVSVTIDWR